MTGPERTPPRAIEGVLEALARFTGLPASARFGRENAPPSDPRIALCVGTPCFAPPQGLLDALADAVARPHFDYAPNQGTVAAREAIAALHHAAGESIPPERIFITHGAKVAVLAILGTLLTQGDEVVLPTPAYPPYLAIPEIFGARVVPVERQRADFAFDPDAIEAAVSERTRMIIVSSPCNPTGATLTNDVAERLVTLCRRRGIRLLSDEAYEAFRFAEASVASPHAFDPEGDVVIRVRSVSKTYSLCGWRTGWVTTSAEAIVALTRFQASNINPPNTLMQAAIEAAPTVPASFHDAARIAIRSRIDAILDALEPTALRCTNPDGGFYIMADLADAMERTGHDSAASFCRDLALTQGVALWPGEDYVAPGYARISAASLPEPSDANTLAQRIQRFTDGYRSLR